MVAGPFAPAASARIGTASAAGLLRAATAPAIVSQEALIDGQ